MNLMRLFLALLLLQQSPAAQNPASVSGFVVKIGTNEPLSKAIVTLASVEGGRGQTYSASTSADGKFLIEKIPPGKYRLSAVRNGYVRYEFGARGPNRPGLQITVGAGQKMTQVVMPLSPAATITGRIFDRDGEPLARANVQALQYSYQDGRRVLNNVQLAQTNDLGEYRLFWLNPGRYYVGATYSPMANNGRRFNFNFGGRGNPQLSLQNNDEGYVPVYYPGTIDAQSAAPINLEASMVFSGVDITVTAVRTGSVRVRVIDSATGQPAARGAQVQLAPRQNTWAGGGSFGNLADQGQGIFEIRDVVSGSYDVIAFVNDRNNRRTARTMVEVSGSDVQNISLTLTSGFMLPGRVTVEGTASLSNVRVTLRPDGRMIGGPGGGAPAGVVQPDGTFMLRQVGFDSYRVGLAGLPRNAYVKSVRLGATDILNEGLRLEKQPTGPVEILVSLNTGTLDATVTNEKQEPAINVTVVAVPDVAHRNRPDLYRFGSTDTTGRLHLDGLPPDDYKVFAWESVESGAWQDPDFLREYEERGKPVRVIEGSAANIELRVIAP